MFVAHRDLGELRHINKLRYWPLESVLHDKYLFPKADADAIASFLTPMLRLHPDKRAKASDLVHHSWLDDVVIQGDLDVIRRAEAEEANRPPPGEDIIGEDGDLMEVDAKDADAMKPVGDPSDSLMSPVVSPSGHAHRPSESSTTTTKRAGSAGSKRPASLTGSQIRSPPPAERASSKTSGKQSTSKSRTKS